jgi:hypothetical protein
MPVRTPISLPMDASVAQFHSSCGLALTRFIMCFARRKVRGELAVI